MRFLSAGNSTDSDIFQANFIVVLAQLFSCPFPTQVRSWYELGAALSSLSHWDPLYPLRVLAPSPRLCTVRRKDNEVAIADKASKWSLECSAASQRRGTYKQRTAYTRSPRPCSLRSHKNVSVTLAKASGAYRAVTGNNSPDTGTRQGPQRHTQVRKDGSFKSHSVSFTLTSETKTSGALNSPRHSHAEDLKETYKSKLKELHSATARPKSTLRIPCSSAFSLSLAFPSLQLTQTTTTSLTMCITWRP
ncbi:hypothetical protein BaRGS_00010046 [Batillaria attramentaria]|uniref:Uncharacterized protein n=1 Tax=Batillaria attramentaria TaxID=370345 RepID=A0ABD0LI48_9CAEN